MPRIYTPVGPESNKAVAPVTETKASVAPAKEPKRNSEKKEHGDS